MALIPRLRRFALGLTVDPAAADDLVQAALERSLTRLHQFTVGTRIDSWMFRIVQTCWIDEVRRASRRGPTVGLEAIADMAEPTTGDIVHGVQTRQNVASAMQCLSPEQRALVMMVLVEGYSYQEAADALDMPLGTVMSRLSRARKALMARLSEVEGDAL